MFSKEEQEKRKKAIAEAAKMKSLRSAQGEYAYEQAEKQAYLSGAEKKGGFLGFGGSYSGKSKEDFATGGAKMTGKETSAVAGKAMAAKSLLEGVTGESVGTSITGGGESGGAVDGAMSGAATGAAFGPYGAAVGAVAGAVMGAASSRAARKAHNAQIEAKKHAALGEIEQERGRQMSAAIGQMGSRMSIR